MPMKKSFTLPDFTEEVLVRLAKEQGKPQNTIVNDAIWHYAHIDKFIKQAVADAITTTWAARNEAVAKIVKEMVDDRDREQRSFFKNERLNLLNSIRDIIREEITNNHAKSEK